MDFSSTFINRMAEHCRAIVITYLPLLCQFSYRYAYDILMPLEALDLSISSPLSVQPCPPPPRLILAFHLMYFRSLPLFFLSLKILTQCYSQRLQQCSRGGGRGRRQQPSSVNYSKAQSLILTSAENINASISGL